MLKRILPLVLLCATCFACTTKDISKPGAKSCIHKSKLYTVVNSDAELSRRIKQCDYIII